MANMSYCAFQNTKIDVTQCKTMLENGSLQSMSNAEYIAFEQMIEEMEEIVEAYRDGEYGEREEDDDE